MESMEQGKAALISSIETDARGEEAKILRDAEVQAAEKRKYTETKITSVLNEAREKARGQADAVKRKILSGTELEIKRHSLQVRQEVIRDIVGRVEGKLEAMMSEPSYRAVLCNWITEAAVGLDVVSAEVNASARERGLIDEALLAEAGGKIRTHLGKPVALRVSGEAPLEAQGVVLTGPDGRMAFNSQVGTRLLRKQREIHRLIYEALFTAPK